MKGFSKAIIAGNITRDPETRATPNGASVTNFAVAVNRSYKGTDGNMVDQVSYIECVAWGKPGETIAQYLSKGSPILLSGRIEQRSWDDKTTGQKRSRTEVIVEDFNFIGGNGDGGSSSGASTGRRSSKKAAAPVDDFVPDDIPEDESINLDDIPF